MGKSKKNGATRPVPVQKRKVEYDSGSSDDDTEGYKHQAVPLPSLENAAVRDFTDQVVKEVVKKKKNKKTKKEPAHVANEPEVVRKKEDIPLEEKKKRLIEQKAVRSEKVVWRKFGRENTSFEKYYKNLWKLDDDEWKTLTKCLETPSSVHFRINGTYPSLSENAKGSLECDFDVDGSTLKLTTEEELLLHLGPVSWAPDQSIWKINVDNKLLRKTKHLDGINTFIRDHSAVGTIIRQEPTNLLLPMYLDIQPGQCVLDLNGSGGSRAAQCVESLLGSSDSSPRGLFVVNEQDAASATNAVRMVSQTVANASVVIVTAHKSEEYPQHDESVFDRILCSAPCSGDGSIRKFPEKWRTWSPSIPYSFHNTQLELALKSLELLKVGGKMVYSTRAFSPIENEAVVAELLRLSKGSCELVDISNVVPGLKVRHGHASWKVVDDEMTEYQSYDATPEDVRKKLKVRPSMYAPNKKEASKLHLDKCIRILPHDNDTHGTFVAVLQKNKNFDRVQAGPAAPSTDHSVKKSKTKKEKKRVGTYSKIEPAYYEDITSKFGIDLPSEHFLEYSTFTKTRELHYVSPEVHELLTEHAGRLHVHKAGTSVFQVAQNSLSLVDDGLRAIIPHCSDRVVSLDMAEFTQLVNAKHAWLKHLSEKAQSQLDKLTDGCVILVLDESEPIQTSDSDIAIAGLKRHSSLSVTALSSTIGRIKALMLELNVDDEEGYDSMEYDE